MKQSQLRKLIKEELNILLKPKKKRVVKEAVTYTSEDDWCFNKYRDAENFIDTCGALGICANPYMKPVREGLYYYVKFNKEHKDNYETVAQIYDGIVSFDKSLRILPTRM